MYLITGVRERKREFVLECARESEMGGKFVLEYECIEEKVRVCERVRE